MYTYICRYIYIYRYVCILFLVYLAKFELLLGPVIEERSRLANLPIFEALHPPRRLQLTSSAFGSFSGLPADRFRSNAGSAAERSAELVLSLCGAPVCLMLLAETPKHPASTNRGLSGQALHCSKPRTSRAEGERYSWISGLPEPFQTTCGSVVAKVFWRSFQKGSSPKPLNLTWRLMGLSK